MLCGLGRCIVELKSTDDRMRYYDCVLWACTHVISYEPPSEGMRGDYIWQMIKCFEDMTPFLSAILEGFQKCPADGGWKFEHYCSLLAYFAGDGNKQAQTALEEKYLQVYTKISASKNVAAAVNSPLGQNFDLLSVELLRGGIDAYLRIAHDIGKLYMENRRYESWDFESLAELAENMFGKSRVDAALKKAAKSDPAVKAYLDVKDFEFDFQSDWPEKLMRQIENAAKANAPDFLDSSAALDWNAAKTYIEEGGEEAAARYTEAALATKDNERKALMLTGVHVAWHKWPLSIETLMKCLKTEHDKAVREAIFKFLKELKTESAHRFACEVLETSDDSQEKAAAIIVLLKNYQPEDKDILFKALRSLPIKREAEVWHDVVSAILGVFEEDNPEEIPKELLHYIYENSLCSFCRTYAVRDMLKQHMLTDEILHECLYDCSKNIRDIAERKLRIKASRK